MGDLMPQTIGAGNVVSGSEIAPPATSVDVGVTPHPIGGVDMVNELESALPSAPDGAHLTADLVGGVTPHPIGGVVGILHKTEVVLPATSDGTDLMPQTIGAGNVVSGSEVAPLATSGDVGVAP